MSRLRFSILIAASSFGVLLVAASASSSRPPEVYSVSDETGRASPTGNVDDGTKQTFRKWATRQRFYVGDVLDFERSSDSVLLVRQGDYDRCTAANPVRRFFADGGGGDTRFRLGRPGLFYFISGVPARCEAGQRMVVRVVDPLNIVSGAAPTPAPAPATTPGTEPPADTLSSRRRRRHRLLSIAEMQMVAGALGFAAGFVTVFFIVGLFICCPFVEPLVSDLCLRLCALVFSS